MQVKALQYLPNAQEHVSSPDSGSDISQWKSSLSPLIKSKSCPAKAMYIHLMYIHVYEYDNNFIVI